MVALLVISYVILFTQSGFSQELSLDSLPQMPGWPISINGAHATGVSLADIDGDGYLEILVGAQETCEFHVWNYHGNELPGWPKNLPYELLSKAAIGDIDPSYPGLEIVVPDLSAHIHAWHYDGTDVPGWPYGGCMTRRNNAPAIFDIDYDGDLEILYSSQSGVFVLNHDGTNYPGWPQYTSSLGTPSVADIDNDGVVEICIQTYSSIYLYDKDGNIEQGWPIVIPNSGSSYVQPVLADLDGDDDFGKQVSAGVYFIRMKTACECMTQKVVKLQ